MPSLKPWTATSGGIFIKLLLYCFVSFYKEQKSSYTITFCIHNLNLICTSRTPFYLQVHFVVSFSTESLYTPVFWYPLSLFGCLFDFFRFVASLHFVFHSFTSLSRDRSSQNFTTFLINELAPTLQKYFTLSLRL